MSNRKGGIFAFTLDHGDVLFCARLSDGRREIVLVTALGQAIRFPEEQVRPMGRAAHGVKGIDLEAEDRVVEMEVAKAEADLLVITENGYGKRTPLEEYRRQARGGKGIKTINLTRKNGPIIGARVVAPEDGLMVVTAAGIIIRTKVQDISQMGRGTQGVRIIRLEEGDRVVALAHVVNREEEED